jgi:hypothetical protein
VQTTVPRLSATVRVRIWRGSVPVRGVEKQRKKHAKNTLDAEEELVEEELVVEELAESVGVEKHTERDVAEEHVENEKPAKNAAVVGVKNIFAHREDGRPRILKL